MDHSPAANHHIMSAGDPAPPPSSGGGGAGDLMVAIVSHTVGRNVDCNGKFDSIAAFVTQCAWNEFKIVQVVSGS